MHHRGNRKTSNDFMECGSLLPLCLRELAPAPGRIFLIAQSQLISKLRFISSAVMFFIMTGASSLTESGSKLPHSI